MRFETDPVSCRHKHVTNPMNLQFGDFHIISKVFLLGV